MSVFIEYVIQNMCFFIFNVGHNMNLIICEGGFMKYGDLVLTKDVVGEMKIYTYKRF